VVAQHLRIIAMQYAELRCVALHGREVRQGELASRVQRW
jgi:hypothetical protein